MNEAPKVTQRCHSCTGELSTHTQDGETTVEARTRLRAMLGAMCHRAEGIPCPMRGEGKGMAR